MRVEGWGLRISYRHVVVFVDDGELKRCLSLGLGSCEEGLLFRSRQSRVGVCRLNGFYLAADFAETRASPPP